MALLKLNYNDIDRFIIENWEIMSDKEMAEKNEVSDKLVILKRRNLNLKRPKGRKIGTKNKDYKFDRTKIDKKEIIYALTIDGFTMSEFIKMKGWNISRQGFYLILNDLEIDLLIKEKRTFIWYINKNIRIHPQLLNEDWLKKRTQNEILKELKITLSIFNEIKKFLCLEIKIFKKREKIILLICNYCGKHFQRRFANYNQSKNRRQKNFYCLQKHYFAYLKENKKS